MTKSLINEIESKFQELQEKDWDGDGKQETDSEEYLGVRDKAIQAAMAKQKSDEAVVAKDAAEAAELAKKPEFEDVDIKVEEDIDEAHCNTKQEDVDEEVQEISTSAATPGYMTANAFMTPDQFEKKTKKMKYASVAAAMDEKYSAMIESYSKFATGNPKLTPSQTVNGTIREVAKKLQEIEQLVRYTSRLKNESGIAGSTYGKSTKNALGKISERLLKISERVRSLGE